MTVEEAQRLIAASHDTVKLHVSKGRAAAASNAPQQQRRAPPANFRFSVELTLDGRPLGLALDDALCVAAIEKGGLAWR